MDADKCKAVEVQTQLGETVDALVDELERPVVSHKARALAVQIMQRNEVARGVCLKCAEENKS
jgi:hypothetical protein